MEFNWFMARYHTNKYTHVDTIQAYKLHRQHSFNYSHKLSIGYSYSNLAHNHLIWSLMASTRSHISRWPNNVGLRRKAQTVDINHGLTSSQSIITATRSGSVMT